MKQDEKKKQIKKLKVEDLVADPFKTMIRRALRTNGDFIRPSSPEAPARKKITQTGIVWQ